MKVIKDGLIYRIDKNSLTAIVIGANVHECGKYIIIPRFIDYSKQKYVVNKIGHHAFNSNRTIKTIQFPSDSEIQIIEEEAFAFSAIESITIPKYVKKIERKTFFGCFELSKIEILEDSELISIERCAFVDTNIKSIFIPAKVKKLEFGWCSSMHFLTTISVSPKNSFFKLINNEILVGKTHEKQDYYENLIFVDRKIEKFVIPTFIKHINSFAFSGCSLSRIEFPENSELQTIDDSAFAGSNLTDITIHPSVKIIGDFAFAHLLMFRKIEFFENSELISIGKKAFFWTQIEDIAIPKNVREIKSDAFEKCKKLKQITIPKNSELLSIGKGAFHETSIIKLFIPPKLVFLEECWCSYTKKLVDISISSENKHFLYGRKILYYKTNEQLENYDMITFASRDIEEAVIPSFIKYIDSCAFENCTNLHSIELPIESELISIGIKAFYCTLIECISIPCHVKNIDDFAFCLCKNLKKIEFSNDSKVEIFGKYAFSNTSIESITIPRLVKRIKEGTFQNCKNLKTIDFQKDSELESIEKSAFFGSSLTHIYFPSKLKELENDWSNNALNLVDIEISPKNKFFSFYNNQILVSKTYENQEKFNKMIFVPYYIEKVSIPSFIEIIGSNVFKECHKLNEIEFQKNSKLHTIQKNVFSYSKIKSMIIPNETETIECDFYWSYIVSIEFLAEKFNDLNICGCKNLRFISFPNAHKVKISIHLIADNSTLFINCGAELSVIFC